ncbi:11215_t:CDS:2, partial [Ambispora leptoticha]
FVDNATSLPTSCSLKNEIKSANNQNELPLSNSYHVDTPSICGYKNEIKSVDNQTELPYSNYMYADDAIQHIDLDPNESEYGDIVGETIVEEALNVAWI